MIKSLSWGKITPIAIKNIEGEQALSHTRQFIAAIGLDRREKLFDAYLCANQRNGAIRKWVGKQLRSKVHFGAGRNWNMNLSLKNENFCLSTRQAMFITAGILVIF